MPTFALEPPPVLIVTAGPFEGQLLYSNYAGSGVEDIVQVGTEIVVFVKPRPRAYKRQYCYTTLTQNENGQTLGNSQNIGSGGRIIGSDGQTVSSLPSVITWVPVPHVTTLDGPITSSPGSQADGVSTGGGADSPQSESVVTSVHDNRKGTRHGGLGGSDPTSLPPTSVGQVSMAGGSSGGIDPSLFSDPPIFVPVTTTTSSPSVFVGPVHVTATDTGGGGGGETTPTLAPVGPIEVVPTSSGGDGSTTTPPVVFTGPVHVTGTQTGGGSTPTTPVPFTGPVHVTETQTGGGGVGTTFTGPNPAQNSGDGGGATNVGGGSATTPTPSAGGNDTPVFTGPLNVSPGTTVPDGGGQTTTTPPGVFTGPVHVTESRTPVGNGEITTTTSPPDAFTGPVHVSESSAPGGDATPTTTDSVSTSPVNVEPDSKTTTTTDPATVTTPNNPGDQSPTTDATTSTSPPKNPVNQSPTTDATTSTPLPGSDTLPRAVLMRRQQEGVVCIAEPNGAEIDPITSSLTVLLSQSGTVQTLVTGVVVTPPPSNPVAPITTGITYVTTISGTVETYVALATITPSIPVSYTAVTIITSVDGTLSTIITTARLSTLYPVDLSTTMVYTTSISGHLATITTIENLANIGHATLVSPTTSISSTFSVPPLRITLDWPTSVITTSTSGAVSRLSSLSSRLLIIAIGVLSGFLLGIV